MSFYEDRIFPPVMEWATRVFRNDIAQLIAKAQGRVLEIGAGTGANLDFYSDQVAEVIGIEPVEAMLETARQKVQQSPRGVPVSLQVGDARHLPFEDDSFDSVVACLVYCTIPDPHLAAAEMHRVLKPGGKLIFFEHVVSKRSWVRRAQRSINPMWRRLACGCEITRDTRALFEHAGFSYEQINDFNHPKVPPLMAPVISGIAVK